ncbi:hypothetical protein GCM10025298_15320 [Natronobiforma cellulositropha]|nr:hypothetical protein [Natronobiforma cellulositropha]
MNPFARGDTGGDFLEERSEWNADLLPEPGPFLEGHDVLTDDAHVAFHDLTHELFERRGVYDVTFGYNLAALNRDRRFPDAGFRYAVDAGDPAVLRAVFTPTTAFCPQAETLVKGSFRAWNGLGDDHDYDLVRVRVSPDHYQADAIAAELDTLEAAFLETGTVDRQRRSLF